MPVAVRSPLWFDLAMPKSASSSRPPPPSITLAGFTSRWRTPAACAASSAEASWRIHSIACAGVTSPRFETLGERAVLEKRHHQVGLALGVAEVVDGEHVLVLERRHRARLGQEALVEARFAGEVGQDDLDRDATAERLVARLPHLGHAAASDQTLQSIATEVAAGARRHALEPCYAG